MLPEHEVPVIGRQAKRQETHRREFAGVQQQALEGRIVGGVAEDRRPTNQAVQHGADQTACVHAFRSWHAPQDMAWADDFTSPSTFQKLDPLDAGGDNGSVVD